MRSKNLGMRPSGTTSLTGRVDSPRQNELSSSRGLHTPYITVVPRHPDYAHSRNSLTVAPETVWPRVGSTHSADQNNHMGLLVENDCKIITRDMNLYKEFSIKQATAAHHVKILSSHIEYNEPPTGLLSPITAALKTAISVPFSGDPDFSRRITDSARKFSLEMADTLNHFWEQKASQLRNEVRAIKDRIYTRSIQLDTNELYTFQSRMRKMENAICWEKRKMAKTREWKLNKFGKRPLETQGISHMARKTDMGNKTPAMNSHAPADISRPQQTTDTLKMACGIHKPRDNYTPCHTAEMTKSRTDKVVTVQPPIVTNLETGAIAENTLPKQEMEAILCPFTQTKSTENTNVIMKETVQEIAKMYENLEHSTPKKPTEEKFHESKQTHINISPILSPDLSNTQLTYDSIWHNEMESIVLTCEEVIDETQSDAQLSLKPSNTNKNKKTETDLISHTKRKTTLSNNQNESKTNINHVASRDNTELTRTSNSEQVLERRPQSHVTTMETRKHDNRDNTMKQLTLNPNTGSNTHQNRGHTVNTSSSNQTMHTGDNRTLEKSGKGPSEFNIYTCLIDDIELRQIIENARKGSNSGNS